MRLLEGLALTFAAVFAIGVGALILLMVAWLCLNLALAVCTLLAAF